jgi:hypothetical protein
MNPPEIKWEEKAPGLHYCYVGDSGRVSYHFRGRGEGVGILCEGEEFGEHSILGGMSLSGAKRFVELDVRGKADK